MLKYDLQYNKNIFGRKGFPVTTYFCIEFLIWNDYIEFLKDILTISYKTPLLDTIDISHSPKQNVPKKVFESSSSILCL